MGKYIGDRLSDVFTEDEMGLLNRLLSDMYHVPYTIPMIEYDPPDEYAWCYDDDDDDEEDDEDNGYIVDYEYNDFWGYLYYGRSDFAILGTIDNLEIILDSKIPEVQE